jgi:hypothetical protein
MRHHRKGYIHRHQGPKDPHTAAILGICFVIGLVGYIIELFYEYFWPFGLTVILVGCFLVWAKVKWEKKKPEVIIRERIVSAPISRSSVPEVQQAPTDKVVAELCRRGIASDEAKKLAKRSPWLYGMSVDQLKEVELG